MRMILSEMKFWVKVVFNIDFSFLHLYSKSHGVRIFQQVAVVHCLTVDEHFLLSRNFLFREKVVL